MEILWRPGFLEVRRVVTHPTFTVVVMLGLTVAIGLNTFLYNFAGLIVRRPLPFQSADELVLISELDSEIGRAGFSSSLFLRLVNQSRRMKQMAGFSWDLMDVSSERVGIAYVTENLCSLLGTRPVQGRTFQLEDYESNATPVVLLSYPFWQRHFKEDPSAVGRILQAGPANLKIVGVLPQEFRLWSTGQTELYLPLRLSPGQEISPGVRGIRALGRLQQGVSLEQAQAEIEAITSQFRSENSLAKSSGEVSVKALQEIPREGFPEIWRTVYWLLGVVSFVLLIAYVNFASLVLQRRRGMEVAVKRPVTPSCEV